MNDPGCHFSLTATLASRAASSAPRVRLMSQRSLCAPRAFVLELNVAAEPEVNGGNKLIFSVYRLVDVRICLRATPNGTRGLPAVVRRAAAAAC